ncbi:enoyl-CoA hydratase/isomerase family protein [Bordetella bronchiseptica]|uniref:enoyl-CoA hydratase/isomerase family protein n=1 Tax=Bordetella bronchiseptica TaxID=518 RepID=UPI001244A051|nr:enoyl-CoA hydratase/isomerase family protein [Bordetella bronchiseptica]KAB1448827.1 enoyl-CoA hydratase/isomerase family protein [Bordetella bronchiseptica]KAB1575088.1 enoyl-CoA hydratase/isomerase family protein [Bordetella bronchiseptica]
MTLLIDNPAPHVRRLTLNRPERMNALDGPTLQMLNDAVRECGAAADVKVLVIRGQGRAFCAGNDLKWLAGGVLADRAAHMRHQDLMQDTYERLESAPQIVLASVNGYAMAGGFELALACDLMIADAQAQLGDEHIRRNLLPSGGSSQRLPRKLGLQRAMYYLVTGRRMTGQEAVELGLAAQAVSAEQLERATLELAGEIARADALALASMKEMVRKSMELPLSDGLRHERWMQHRYRTQSPSLEAGVARFAGGRKDG